MFIALCLYNLLCIIVYNVAWQCLMDVDSCGMWVLGGPCGLLWHNCGVFVVGYLAYGITFTNGYFLKPV